LLSLQLTSSCSGTNRNKRRAQWASVHSKTL
jgi:hypothetical protein